MQLHKGRFLAVVGASGCGKSSLVRAGLIPKLEAGFLVQECDRWIVVRMKPGSEPLDNLAEAIAGAGGIIQEGKALAEFQASVPRCGIEAILERLKACAGDTEANFLLLVDQFEEVFRFGFDSERGRPSAQATGLVDLIIQLAAQRDLRVYVCLTMRSDYFGDCDKFYGLPQAMNQGQYLVPRLTREQLREAIIGPVHLFDASVTSRLQNRLLNDVGDTPDELPVLQHALMLTWQRWLKTERLPIDLDVYEAIGTMTEAISRDAAGALAGISEEEFDCTKRLFQALTETDASNRRVRRPTRVGDLAAICGTSKEQILAIAERFRRDDRSFVTLSESERATDDVVIDLSHESLIRRWLDLEKWVAEEAESAKNYRRLADAAARHREGKASLYRGVDLQTALEWKVQQRPNAAWANRYSLGLDVALTFLEESQAAQHRELEADEKRSGAELRRFRIFAIVVTVLLLICIGLLVVVGVARNRAEQATQTAAAKEKLASQAFNTLLGTSDAAGVVHAMDNLTNGDHVTLEQVLELIPAWRLRDPEWFANVALALHNMELDKVAGKIKAEWARTLRNALTSRFCSSNGFGLPPDTKTDSRLNQRIYLTGNAFQMGGDKGDKWYDEKPQHAVAVSSFYIQEHEVTNEEYARFDHLHSFDRDNDARRPVVHVNWYEARSYAVWLGGDLPTEAQWEFAARGTQDRRYPWGPEDQDAAHKRANLHSSGTVPVKSYEDGKTPDGVYDLAGNVWEWCRDWFARYPKEKQLDPFVSNYQTSSPIFYKGRVRVLRGGSFYYKEDPAFHRSAYRGNYSPEKRSDYYGFRVAWDTTAIGSISPR